MTKPIEMWMLRTEALRVSKNHIRAVLRSKGFKLSTFSQAELNSLARRWFEANRTELIGQALGSLARARKQEREKSRASAVQMLGAE